jgi:hypothetical protein
MMPRTQTWARHKNQQTSCLKLKLNLNLNLWQIWLLGEKP